MSCAIAVMAKAPRAGHSKTRLTPPLLPEEAKAMSAAFLHDITENIHLAAQQADITGYVAYAPAGLEDLFDGILAPGTRLVLADGTGAMPDDVQGFGRSLLHATRSLFARGHHAVCVLNSDSPTLPTSCLVQAARTLADHPGEVVLGAAEDGGYYLLGMTAPHPALYANIAWSTERVAAQTRAAAAAIGLPMHELPAWYDVDDRAALTRLLVELDGGGAGYAAPATAHYVAQLALRDRLAG
jgi:rSAM/selenodomain-associated transferase 1